MQLHVAEQSEGGENPLPFDLLGDGQELANNLRASLLHDGTCCGENVSKFLDDQHLVLGIALKL